MQSFPGVRFLLGAFLPLGLLAADPLPPAETFTYKTVGTLAIQADVYRPGSAPSPHPVVVSLHGGSLINGGRAKLDKPPRILDHYLAAGFMTPPPLPRCRLPGFRKRLSSNG